MPTDKLRDTIAARAEQLGLSAYEIAQRLGGRPSKESVARYLTGRCNLGSSGVSAICDVLGLSLKACSGKTR